MRKKSPRSGGSSSSKVARLDGSGHERGGREADDREATRSKTNRDGLAQSSDYDFAGSSSGGDGGLAMRQSWKNNMCR